MDDELNLKFEFFFDDDMTSFAIHLDSKETLEVGQLAEALIDFARKLRSGEVMMYDSEDETVVH